MRTLRFFLAAFGDAGHAFPMLALGTRLAERGHDVVLETWTQWQEHASAGGMQFVAAPEYPVFPTGERQLSHYEAVVLATAETRPALADFAPDVVVHDILTLAPAMAAELEDIPAATLVPHVYPVGARGLPPYAFGARRPRTAIGRKAWARLDPLVETGLRSGRSELNATRVTLGLPPTQRLHGGLSERLCIVGTFPHLEYPRLWPASVRVVGPLMWEPPFGEVQPPPGDAPLVLVAPSTAQDPSHRLLQAAVAGLADEPVRVLATWNRRLPPIPLAVPANARAVEWVSYSRTMPECALVLCNAGHGTMVRALASGCPVLCAPHAGDMAENAARADWAGVGVRVPWRLLGPASVRLAVRRVLGDGSFAARARGLGAWAAAQDGAARAADLVQELALSRRGASARTR